MATVIKRRIDGLHTPKKFINNPESILFTNKSKCLNWWRVLRAERSLQCAKPLCIPVPENVRDQVRLDVNRAFCFDSGFPSNLLVTFSFANFLEIDILEKRERLFKVIISVLERNPSFKYYQVYFLIFLSYYHVLGIS